MRLVPFVRTVREEARWSIEAYVDYTANGGATWPRRGENRVTVASRKSNFYPLRPPGESKLGDSA